MPNIKVTGSGLGQLRKCQWWARPDISYPEKPAAYAASLGHAFHYVAPFIFGGLPAMDAAHPADAPFSAVYLDAAADKFSVNEDELIALWDAAMELNVPEQLGLVGASDYGAVRYEQAIAYDVNTRTAQFINIPGARQYPAVPEGERVIFMTLDYIYADQNRLVVLDWKTGWGRYLDPLDRNLQLLFGAAAALKATEAAVNEMYLPRDISVVIPRINSSRSELEVVKLLEMDLAAAEAEVQALVAHIDTSAPQPSASACRFCPARSICPAIEDTVRGAVVEFGGEAPMPPFHLVGPVSCPEEAAARLRLYPLMSGVLKEEQARLEAYADANGGIPMGDGTVWRKVVTPTEFITLDETATGYLREELPEALKLTASKTGIEEALKAKGLKGKAKTPVLEGILSTLREMGALAPGTPRVGYKALPPIKEAENVIGPGGDL